MELLFLGSGTSNGIPEIGCKCMVCKSVDPKNKRFRSSVLVKTGTADILIDTTPDLRIQALTNEIDRIDAVCFTHHHADHIYGLDELRRFNSSQNNPIPCFAMQETIDFIRGAFPYIFNPHPKFTSYVPKLDFHIINDIFSVAGQEIIPVEVGHAGMKVLGFRIGGMAYLTDCNYIPESSRPLLQNLDILVLDALRPTAHVSHFTLDQAIDEALKIKAAMTYFTHIAHDIEHEKVSGTLPAGIKLAYDGLMVTY